MTVGRAERRCARGFSLVEMLVAMAIVTSAFAVFLQLMATAQRVARAQPAAADMYQTLRVAADMLQRDLLMAGAGVEDGALAGPLANHLPPVLPYRTGARRADPELSFFSDRVTILYAEAAAAAVPLLWDMASAGAEVPIDTTAPGCPLAGRCGFGDGTRTLIVDTSGVGRGFNLFSVSGPGTGLAHGAPDPGFSQAYQRATARVIPVRQRVYYLDSATRRLMVYDGYQTDAPLAENVVALRFEYFVDPWPSAAPRPQDVLGNCVYSAGAPAVPRLADLGGPALVPASSALLTDGPVCGVSPGRFDGDLLRIRRVRVTLRAEVPDPSLRGSGTDVFRPGLSPGGQGAVPDIAVRFDVTPRNLQATR